MSEKCPKLKLKRKKLSVQENKCEQNADSFVKEKFPNVPWENCKEAESVSSESYATAWWSLPCLRETERLWASALMSAVPHLEQRVWDTVPDLPLTAPASPLNKEDKEWRQRCLTEEVSPLPQALQTVGSTCSTVGFSSILAEDCALPGQRCGSGPAQKNRNPNAPCPSREEEPADLQAAGSHSFRLEDEKEHVHVLAQPSGLWDSVQPDLLGTSVITLREELVAPASSAAGGREQYRGTGEWGRPARVGACLDTGAATVVARPSQDAPQAERTSEPDGSTCQGAALASCPMCLMPFPAGASQMDCDSHLAKCLSEMSEDVVW